MDEISGFPANPRFTIPEHLLVRTDVADSLEVRHSRPEPLTLAPLNMLPGGPCRMLRGRNATDVREEEEDDEEVQSSSDVRDIQSSLQKSTKLD